MRLIEIQGDVSQIRAKKKDENWSQRFGDVSAYAVIEITVGRLPQQNRYVIYRHNNGKLYCNVRRQRVYLEMLGYTEGEPYNPIVINAPDRYMAPPSCCPFCGHNLEIRHGETDVACAYCNNDLCEFAGIDLTARQWAMLYNMALAQHTLEKIYETKIFEDLMASFKTPSVSEAVRRKLESIIQEFAEKIIENANGRYKQENSDSK